MGLSGNILVKSNITKSKFDNVFDIRKEYCLYIQSMRKIHFLVFFKHNDCGENLWKFLRTFLLVPNFQNMIGWVPMMIQGFNPYFILGSNIFFPSRYSSFCYCIFVKVVESK